MDELKKKYAHIEVNGVKFADLPIGEIGKEQKKSKDTNKEVPGEVKVAFDGSDKKPNDKKIENLEEQVSKIVATFPEGLSAVGSSSEQTTKVKPKITPISAPQTEQQGKKVTQINGP